MSATPIETADLCIANPTVVTMNAERDVQVASVYVRDGRIVQIGGRRKATRSVDARGMILIPGLIQSHVHLCQALFRGMADDLPLLAWLKERIWPFEAAHNEKSIAASAELGIAEMLLGGTTTILDMGTVHHQHALMKTIAKTGIRAFAGKALMDVGEGVPRGLMQSTRRALKESHELCAEWNGKGRIRYAYAPRFILSCTEGLMREVAHEAKARGALIHSHVAEHAEERDVVRSILGQDDLAALESYGICGPHVVLAHGVQLRLAEMKRAARLGTRFVHCPSANLKLASGIADVSKMRDAGLVVGIGADGAPCNNRMDAFTELRSAALLAKVKRFNAAELLARDVFALATIDGARVLGVEKDIGSIEVGKRADLALIASDALHQVPGHEVYGKLVYSTTPHDVHSVFVDGEELVSGGELVRMDRQRTVRRAQVEAARLLDRVT